MTFLPWQWALLIFGAFLAGFSKTGIPGIGILFVAVFANVMPARQSTGVVLPLLMLGDIFGVVLYRRHTQWSHLWRLFPATAAGVVLGWLALRELTNAQTTRMMGGTLALMLVVHLWRSARGKTGQGSAIPLEEKITHAPWWFAAIFGLLTGFATQVANAAGSVMTLYLLAMRLPKLEFLGTAAVFFMLLNWFKVPFMMQLGLLNSDSLALNLRLAPFVILGAWLGRPAVAHINQKVFEMTALILTAAATVKLVFF